MVIIVTSHNITYSDEETSLSLQFTRFFSIRLTNIFSNCSLYFIQKKKNSDSVPKHDDVIPAKIRTGVSNFLGPLKEIQKKLRQSTIDCKAVYQDYSQFNEKFENSKNQKARYFEL